MVNGTADLEKAREFCELGKAEAEKNNYEKAIEYYTKSLESKNDYIPSLCNRAVMYNHVELYDKSLSDFKAALDAELSKPEPSEEQLHNIREAIAGAYFFLGEEKRLADDCEKAIEYYSVAMEQIPDFCDAIKSLGLAQSQMGLYKESIETFNKVIEINPNYENIYRYRAMSYTELDENELALPDINKHFELHPDDTESYALKGLIEYELGQYKNAVDSYSKYIAVYPSDAKGYYFRHHAYKELGETELSDKDFKKAVELDPEYAEE